LTAPSAGLHPTVAAFVDSRRSEHLVARATVLPALAHWGLPHRVVDLAVDADPAGRAEGCGVLLVAQEYMGEPLGALLPRLEAMVIAGAGWVSVDHALGTYPARHRELLGLTGDATETSTGAIAVGDEAHAITAGQAPGTQTRLKQPIPSLRCRTDSATVVAVQDDGGPALLTARHGNGRVVQWGVSPKLWHPSYLGLAQGLDGLLWRALVWAAPKPVVLNAMPPFVRYRFDDCYGHWREPQDFAFVEELNARGHVPSICFCLRSLTAAGASHAADLHRAGRIELTPHTLAPGTSIFHGTGEREYTADELKRIFDELDDAERRWNLRWSPILSDHDHEWSANAVPFLRERGFRYKMNITLPGEQWTGLHTDWAPRPYGSMNYALDSLPDPWSDFFVVFNHHPSFETARVPVDRDTFLYHRPGGFGDQKWDFLNGLTPAGAPSDAGLSAAAGRIEAHTRIGLDSLFFGGSITHSHFTRHLDRGHWRRLLDDADRRLRGIEQLPASYEHVARYAEARSGTELVDVQRVAGELRCVMQGRSSTPLTLSVFDESDGFLVRTEQAVPAFEGHHVVRVPVERRP
jgi:hypothetical protein